MATPGKLDAAKRARIVDLRAKGLTLAEIADKVGVSDTTVRSALIAAGVPTGPRRRPKVLDEHTLGRLRTMHGQGLTQSEMADRLGVARDTVKAGLAKMGLKLDASARGRLRSRRINNAYGEMSDKLAATPQPHDGLFERFRPEGDGPLARRYREERGL